MQHDGASAYTAAAFCEEATDETIIEHGLQKEAVVCNGDKQ